MFRNATSCFRDFEHNRLLTTVGTRRQFRVSHTFMSRTLLLFIMSACVFAQHTTPHQEPAATTVCEIIHNPAAFSGRIVTVRATVASEFESSTIVDANERPCRGPWFEYALKQGEVPRNSRDAELQRRHPVFLKEDESMKRFNEALRAFAYPRDNRVQSRAAPRYNVTATMTGRVDDAGATRSGFGHLGGYRIRFVLSSVEDVSTEEREVADSPSR